MQRRTFLKRTAAAGLLGGVALNLPAMNGKHEATVTRSDGHYDLVAVKGGGAAEMFNKGIAALGGMRTFVKPGQTVVVKPNIGWAKTPESGANTNPELVGEIVKQCLKAGAAKVYVFDHTCNNWRRSYSKSGIEQAATAAGGKVVCGNYKKDYRSVKLPAGKRLKETMLHHLVLDCDVFINVPVLKNHGGAIMTCAMKNLMGIVWDRGFFHRHDLQQTIADCITARKPDLNVIDAFRVMKKGGPRGRNPADVHEMRYQLLSSDIVAADTAASKILGIASSRIPHLRLGEELKLGTMQLDRLNIKRIKMGSPA